MKIAIIPARGGSKRIPHKNIKPFCGKPMIAWSIEAAKASQLFDQIIVSTDDENIAQIARDYGAQTPFMRPADLADDFTSSHDVIKHAAGWLSQNQAGFDLDNSFICCLYATAPFVRADDLAASLALLQKSDTHFVFSVTDYAFPIQRALRRGADGVMAMFDPNQEKTRSQDLEPAFHDAGQFYWAKAKAWLETEGVFSSRAIGFMLPRYRVQDIDTPEDWQQGEYMMKALNHD